MVVHSDHPLGVNELTKLNGLNRNTNYRPLKALEVEQLVARLPGSRSYVAGPMLIRMSATVLENMNIRGIAHPMLRDLVSLTSETVSLHVRSGFSRVCVDTLQGLHAVRRVISVGQMVPLYAGPSGKAILAFLPLEDYSANMLAAEGAGEDCVALETQLTSIRELGYIAAIGDRIAGVGGLSVPVWDARGIIASVTISGPAERWDQSAMEKAAPRVKEAALELSASLGHANGFLDANEVANRASRLTTTTTRRSR
jgi:DNA-binding IclR family transcriptional regulator